ncbi:beta-galactosidase [Spinactinospora alkalitolerans]|uniref:Beta-galactosidase n=1 Tax=Spinactinospora alkalitolerans TaxID=687207 RepID=A0A852TTK3_9ACTN|nr:beta-galactosidase [Spinactinospora alkalitolerans]NYE46991.1 beta-galactosidase [Spinactinospora alkalitolerans]
MTGRHDRIRSLHRRLGGIGFGGDYNPEQWPEEVWAEDARLMKEAGVNLATVGVFSWAGVEPRPGEFDFGWFDRVMDLLAENDVAADLATMTASPPPWLARTHPETLPVTADGTRLWPGGRQHYCPSSPVYRDRAVRLAEQVATRYAGHPALAMWHVGNEYGCHVPACYCDVSAADFRRWLRERHGDIDALNDAWSTGFWSQGYADFEEVQPPRTAPTFPNPAQQLDYARFTDAALRACYLAELEVLRRVTPDVPVTTNLVAAHKEVDAFTWAPHMDVVSLDNYPDPLDAAPEARSALVFDITRGAGAGEPWLLMEQAPSAVNWRRHNAPKRPGQMRLWSWQAVAQGADAVLYFQWRASRGGAEKYHSAMVPHAGPDTRVFKEVSALGAELARVPGVLGARSGNDVALLLDWNSWWALELDSHPAELDQIDEALAYHTPLLRAGIGVDVVPPDRDLSGYRLVVAPCLHLLDEATGARIADHVRGGGHLVVSYFSGIVDGDDRVHLGGYGGPLRPVLGTRTTEFWPLGPGERVELSGDPAGGTDSGGAPGSATLWSEEVLPEGAEPVARFASGDLAGGPAVTRHRFGDGVATYVATRPDPLWLRALLERAARDAGAEPVLADLPEGVQATRRHGAEETFTFLLNHTGQDRAVALPEPMTDLLADAAATTQVTLPPRGVAVLVPEHWDR